jgi:hypothetical protein
VEGDGQRDVALAEVHLAAAVHGLHRRQLLPSQRRVVLVATGAPVRFEMATRRDMVGMAVGDGDVRAVPRDRLGIAVKEGCRSGTGPASARGAELQPEGGMAEPGDAHGVSLRVMARG